MLYGSIVGERVMRIINIIVEDYSPTAANEKSRNFA